MSKKALENLRETLCEELDEIARKSKMNAGDLEIAHKLTDTIKNIDKICMLEENGEYSYAYDDDMAMRGSSYARGGNNGGGNRGGGNRGGNRGGGGRGGNRGGRSNYGRDDGYSEDDGRSEMMEHLEMALETANEDDREYLRRMMKRMQQDM